MLTSSPLNEQPNELIRKAAQLLHDTVFRLLKLNKFVGKTTIGTKKIFPCSIPIPKTLQLK